MLDEPNTARRPADRTSLIVTTGMVLLAVVGVGTVFGDPILAALSPGAGAEPATPAVTPASTPAATPPSTGTDGGHP
jgi:hypothetical protein